MKDFFSRPSHASGLALGVLGILVLSPDALLLRLLAQHGAAESAIVAGRAALVALVVGTACALFPGARRGMRPRPIVLYALCFGAGLVCFPMSIARTYAANTLILLAVSPLLAAAGARIFLGEKIAPQTWLAALAVAVGAAVLMTSGGEGGVGGVGGVGVGEAAKIESGTKLVGDLLALFVAATLAAGSIVVRGSGGAMLPGVALGGLLSAVALFAFADWQSVMSFPASLLLLADGALVIPLSFALITLAARRLPPPETGLLFLLETFLGSLWVWLILLERPPLPSLLSGLFIASVLIAHSLWALRRGRE